LRQDKQSGLALVGTSGNNPLYETNNYSIAPFLFSGPSPIEAWARRRGLAGACGQAYEFDAGAAETYVSGYISVHSGYSLSYLEQVSDNIASGVKQIVLGYGLYFQDLVFGSIRIEPNVESITSGEIPGIPGMLNGGNVLQTIKGSKEITQSLGVCTNFSVPEFTPGFYIGDGAGSGVNPYGPAVLYSIASGQTTINFGNGQNLATLSVTGNGQFSGSLSCSYDVTVNPILEDGAITIIDGASWGSLPTSPFASGLLVSGAVYSRISSAYAAAGRSYLEAVLSSADGYFIINQAITDISETVYPSYCVMHGADVKIGIQGTDPIGNQYMGGIIYAFGSGISLTVGTTAIIGATSGQMLYDPGTGILGAIDFPQLLINAGGVTI